MTDQGRADDVPVFAANGCCELELPARGGPPETNFR